MSVLFSPIVLAGLSLPNRVVVSPMCQYAAVDGIAQPWHTMHVGQFMVSGAGLVIMEATAVEAAGRISLDCLGLYNDPQETGLLRLVSQLRSFSDTRIGIQLGHAGRKASNHARNSRQRNRPLAVEEGAWPVVGPSAISYDATEGWPVPRELDAGGLARVQNAFRQAAERAARCGFDLIEIHAAHGYLLHSFLSPLTNQRTDAYGGGPERRQRFPVEVVQAVRGAWPKHKPLGVRMTGEDWVEGGLTLSDAVRFARALAEVGVDYITLSGGNIAPEARFPPSTPGYMVHFAERVRREAGITAMAVGMIVDPHQAEAIVAAGAADMVALARAFIDDPRWAWHAAHALGVPIEYARQYWRARPRAWNGYQYAHPPVASAAADPTPSPAAANPRIPPSSPRN